MIAHLSDQERVAYGKAKEHLIVKKLAELGYSITPPTDHQDMYDKIDGFYTAKNGKSKSIQVKYRESGDDVLFEVIKDWDKNVYGRDYVSKAELYIVANRAGVTRMYPKQLFKDLADQILQVVDQSPNDGDWSGNGWEAKLRPDPRNGNYKLIAFISPTLFTPLFEQHLVL